VGFDDRAAIPVLHDQTAQVAFMDQRFELLDHPINALIVGVERLASGFLHDRHRAPPIFETSITARMLAE